MKNKLKKITLFIAFTITYNAFAANEHLDTARKAYADGDFSQACTIYEQLLQQGEAPELYFNLGNAYYKSNSISKAILNYERALRLRPSYKEAKFNLEMANRQIVDKIDPVETFFLSQWIQKLRQSSSSNLWAIWSIVCFSLMLMTVMLYVFGRYRWLRKVSFFMSLLFLSASLVTGIFAKQQKDSFTQRLQAIVMQGSVTIKSSPDASGTELFVLHEGTKVRIINTLGEWYEIRIQDGNIGWVEKSRIERI